MIGPLGAVHLPRKLPHSPGKGKRGARLMQVKALARWAVAVWDVKQQHFHTINAIKEVGHAR